MFWWLPFASLFDPFNIVSDQRKYADNKVKSDEGDNRYRPRPKSRPKNKRKASNKSRKKATSRKSAARKSARKKGAKRR